MIICYSYGELPKFVLHCSYEAALRKGVTTALLGDACTHSPLVRSLRSSNSGSLVALRSAKNLVRGEWALAQAGNAVWHNLPIVITNCISPNSFKSNLKSKKFTCLMLPIYYTLLLYLWFLCISKYFFPLLCLDELLLLLLSSSLLIL